MAPLHLLLATAAVSSLSHGLFVRSSSQQPAYASTGSCPAGYNPVVENFCQDPFILYCCTSVALGAVGLPDAAATGCEHCPIRASAPASFVVLIDLSFHLGQNAMVSTANGDETTYEFGFCPTGLLPQCCTTITASQPRPAYISP